ncbi:hypothetical protein L1987_39507 [Smallanthus sonchifolius]|uniref:Uncharacterized protein n=1 Tax=Smallanthus sonchifolius TaxID=185202 RepID=A0ACB9HMW0_9ASTR|nr:hypothetical protein L1987_39507 [Smallanthus sonchifolius]
MEESRWEERQQALTHILTNPTTTTPSLHSQYLISTQLPCYLNWDYPPILCPKHQLQWAVGLFMKRVGGVFKGSWRSKCPYQQPPPLVLAKGVQPPKWGDEDKREYVKKRLTRKKLGNDINPWIPILLPNLILLSFLYWDPFTP